MSIGQVRPQGKLPDLPCLQPVRGDAAPIKSLLVRSAPLLLFDAIYLL
jgi:hypothetical protein